VRLRLLVPRRGRGGGQRGLTPAGPTGSLRGPVSALTLGITLFLAALGVSWAQDVAAPWWNLGEAKMRGVVAFEADDTRYRVITSGPSRPEVGRTGCSIRYADDTTDRMLGGSGGVNAVERFGVSRVLEFRGRPGTALLTCADRYSRTATLGRFQVVPAGGVLSTAVWIGLGLGVLLVLAGGTLAARAVRAGTA